MSSEENQGPSIEGQEDEPQIGIDEEDVEETSIGDADINVSEQVYEVIEAFHGRAINAEQQAQDRIRELEIQAERGAYETALQVLAVAIEDGEIEAFIQDQELAAQYQEFSRRYRGIGQQEGNE